MKAIWTIARRELNSLFDHPMGYILLVVFIGVNNFLFFAQAMQMLHFEWSGYFDRPIALGLLIAGFLTLGGSIYGSFFKKKPNQSSAT